MAVNESQLQPRWAAGRYLNVGGPAIALVALAVCAIASMSYAETRIPFSTVLDSFLNQDDSFQQTVVRTVRLPRTLVALSVGAALGASGALMQGVTRNPLASPGILAVNAGAALAVILAALYLGVEGVSAFAWFAFAGGGTAAFVVYYLASMGAGGATPVKLALTGTAFSLFLGSFSAALLIANNRTLDEVRFWLVGDVIGRDMSLYLQTTPYFGAAFAGALLLSRQVTTLSLGDDVASGLGQNIRRIRMLAALAAVGLAGTAVALSGPIGFVGLVVPNSVRLITGANYRLVIPYSAGGGAILLLSADLVSRALVREGLIFGHVPVGLLTPIVGVPVFIYFARRMAR
ncbi:MAG: iron ABC transporter permease [Caldilineaceae bacterium SB0661_bin_32]|uniref:Iron ABC transporter permease n=1 Tax=Caldilineaceae bacterium SB0661_bin_32 TaxID=2605255 RepID=A0A6B1DCU7_9CHLR|nr:iron ABC transporter permease [Caldilineaceae bacterium SB0661_bin_32]